MTRVAESVSAVIARSPLVRRASPPRAERLSRRPRPALVQGQPEALPEVVHISAECWPFARTGGLGEAVSTLATHQARSGARASVIIPLYRAVRDAVHGLEVTGPAFEVQLGSRVERVRVLHAPSRLGEARTFFVEHDGFFDRAGIYGEDGTDYADNALRFGFFCRAALVAMPRIAPSATVLHAHDWHAALVPVLLRSEFARLPHLAKVSAVLSVHNAAFQGHYAPETMEALGLARDLFDWRALEWYGRVNLLKGGIALADAVVTVSPTYGRELRTPDGGFGLHETFAAASDRLTGILNGIDVAVWDPETDPHIEATFSALDLRGKRRCKEALQRANALPVRAGVPVVAMCARLTEQKGIDLVLEAMPDAVGAQFIVVGEGKARYTSALARLAERFPGRIATDFTFRDATEHRLLAGADIVLLPSRFEPCGLTQMRAQVYGAVPVARRVGGLADTIQDGVTGFLFDDYTPEGLASALSRTLEAYEDVDVWNRFVRAAMTLDFGWERSVRRYWDVYRDALERRAATHGVSRSPVADRRGARRQANHSIDRQLSIIAHP